MRSAIRDTLDELEQQRLTESNGEYGPARPLDERMLIWLLHDLARRGGGSKWRTADRPGERARQS